MSKSSPASSWFRWSCLGLAAFVSAALLWMVNDMRVAVRANIDTLNENLPEILANTKRSTATLAVVSDDIRHVRDLAGVANGPRDKSLVQYADRLLDLVESSGAQIGLKKKLLGSGLKELVPAEEWSVSARKEALWLSLRAKSKTELLERLSANKFGSDWIIQLEDEGSLPLAEWLAANDAETAALLNAEESAEP